MIDAFKEGDMARALKWHLLLFPIFKGMFIATNPVPVKFLLNEIGLDTGGYRLPIVGPTVAEQEFLEKLVASIRVLPNDV
jgi:4-hydroxy-tetrahydrodipicolinate synthase